jgi:23S rRNA pseudouridine1911/1915/1917 synthase
MEQSIDLSSLQKLNERYSSEPQYSIIEETSDFIVVYKMNGLAVQVTDSDADNLERILNERYKQKLYVLNRIDQPVSGLVIFGRNAEFAAAFTEILKAREVKKTYLALVAGKPEKGPVTLKHYIKKLHNRAMTADEPVNENYKEAILVYERVQSFDNYHLLKIDLKTGRFHQIRAQLATFEMPIKGDLKYGSKRPNLDRSIGLISYRLSFNHPFTGTFYSYEAPLPDNDILWKLVDKSNL